MQIIRGRAAHGRAEQRSATFTGTVWADPVLPATRAGAAGTVTINTVTFTPYARTHWHRHEHGQILHVTAGEGLIGVRDEPPRPLRIGDTVWVPPGETHWHGASAHGLLVHTAVSLGRTIWLEPVTDPDYAGAVESPKPAAPAR
ncbi:cupin domain-containing protein [Streptomyces sp. SL13]|uniref:Cupin domain-containing protein n=1 Tax=Streptantibioticus silvisoli TaxID=2705255 RepID=A0AA90JWJ4_9ACTN|nr:cupin domain-containing protein [Streptantibioticus silvisoli]MDI5962528.1 cupin domain-containing protein [Streptantibioticus silvisoli]MDI5969161.1 cupin domain-containing protein [Streptantibioticus silvisoli]